MKIFLLGHKGFIGSNLLPKLQKLNHEVITDMRYFNDRYDIIINLAAVTHIRNEFDAKMIESNIILANEVFKRPERILYASSCSAAHFTNPYAGTKLWNEYLGNKHGNALGFRFHNVYGQGNNKGIVWYLMQQPDGAKINIRGPELVRDYIFVENVCDEIIRQMKPIKIIRQMKPIKIISRGCRDGRCAPMPGRITNPVFEKNIGVIDVGTGIGTQTMDVVNLFMKISGKRFNISVTEAGANEPEEMVSNNIIPHISLKDGLAKMIIQTDLK